MLDATASFRCLPPEAMFAFFLPVVPSWVGVHRSAKVIAAGVVATVCVCFFVLGNRHWFNKVPGANLGIASLPSAFTLTLAVPPIIGCPSHVTCDNQPRNVRAECDSVKPTFGDFESVSRACSRDFS
jgi:hypothetical protein